MVVLEPTAHALGAQASRANVLIGPAPGWIFFDGLEQGRQPLWWAPDRIQRPAASAGSIACQQRLAGAREEGHVLGTGLLGRARGAAEDACRVHTGDEHALE